VHAVAARAVNEAEVRHQFDTLGMEGVVMPSDPFAVFVVNQARIAQEIGPLQAGARAFTAANGSTLVVGRSAIASGKDNRRPGFPAVLVRCR
jgi:hypothetical protein